MAVTWSPTHKNSTITLSGNNLIATLTTLNHYYPVYSSQGVTTGKIYWEVTAAFTSSGDCLVGVGNVNSTVADDAYPGSATSSFGWIDTGGRYTNSVPTVDWPTWTTGQRLCFALDLTNHKIWGRVTNGNWNNDVIGNQNPATNTGGVTLDAAVYASPVVAGASGFNTNEVLTVFFLQSSWSFTAPSGFTEWPDAADAWPAPTVSF